MSDLGFSGLTYFLYGPRNLDDLLIQEYVWMRTDLVDIVENVSDVLYLDEETYLKFLKNMWLMSKDLLGEGLPGKVVLIKQKQNKNIKGLFVKYDFEGYPSYVGRVLDW